jgi:hypothetical protein
MTNDNDRQHDAFLSGYRDCAEWCGCVIGNGHNEHATPGSLDQPWSAEALDAMRADCARFIEANRADLDEAAALGPNWMSLGHDLFLSRNGHGAGYFDRGREPVWQRLQRAAQAHGAVDFTIESGEIVSA